MMKFAILLHHTGFHITFVNTEYNHNRLLKSRGPAAVQGSPDFRFETIPDGLPPAAADATQDIPSLCLSTRENCLRPLSQLIDKLNRRSPCAPPVSCVVADSVMTFALRAAEEIGVPGVILRLASACSLMCYKHINHLVEKGLVPLKDESYLTNGYLETPIDWVPGMIPLRLKDFPSFIRTTNLNPMLNFVITETNQSSKATAIIINTFDELEQNVLNALSKMCPPIFPVGPLHLLVEQIQENRSEWMSSSLWKEEPECLKWLDSNPPNSVIYVNFGSIAVLNSRQLTEFAWGLAESKKSFLWIMRRDLADKKDDVLGDEFWEEIRGRGYACEEWGVGMEIGSNVRRDEVGFLVRELLDGEKGKMMKGKAMDWKKKAAEAIGVGGSSYLSLDKLVGEVLTV
ncbi:hypothetical protein DH2020_011084 [Rehmannia glutinosa]|uniref:Uncharacterized protein n=1 Tax=Rehmannia glutinosa TaxID=99300 RepID=A0ABR0XCG7_REHGL